MARFFGTVERMRFFLYFLLIFALVGGQTAAAAHALSHVSGQNTSGESGKHPSGHKACEKCLSFAKFGNGMQSASYEFHSQNLGFGYTVFSSNSRLTLASPAFFARAPPALL